MPYPLSNVKDTPDGTSSHQRVAVVHGVGAVAERIRPIRLEIPAYPEQLSVLEQPVECLAFVRGERGEARPATPVDEHRRVDRIMFAPECEAVVDQGEVLARGIEEQVEAAAVLVADESVEERGLQDQCRDVLEDVAGSVVESLAHQRAWRVLVDLWDEA